MTELQEVISLWKEDTSHAMEVYARELEQSFGLLVKMIDVLSPHVAEAKEYWRVKESEEPLPCPNCGSEMSALGNDFKYREAEGSSFADDDGIYTWLQCSGCDLQTEDEYLGKFGEHINPDIETEARKKIVQEWNFDDERDESKHELALKLAEIVGIDNA